MNIASQKSNISIYCRLSHKAGTEQMLMVTSVKRSGAECFHWEQCAVLDNNFMASAKSALYVNPPGRYEQPCVTKLYAVQQPVQGSQQGKLENITIQILETNLN